MTVIPVEQIVPKLREAKRGLWDDPDGETGTFYVVTISVTTDGPKTCVQVHLPTEMQNVGVFPLRAFCFLSGRASMLV